LSTRVKQHCAAVHPSAERETLKISNFTKQVENKKGIIEKMSGRVSGV